MTWLKIRDTVGLTLRPIADWPGKRLHGRDKGPFSAPLTDTLGILRLELKELQAKNIVLQMDFREKDFRLDGLPRADARATSPGVILSFDTPKGPRRKAFDRFHNFEQNLRALAMNLQNLRHANMYGVEGDDGQYSGWKALAAPAEGQEGFNSPEHASRWLSAYSGIPSDAIISDEDVMVRAYRLAARQLHPDVQGGDHGKFLLLDVAVEVIRRAKK